MLELVDEDELVVVELVVLELVLEELDDELLEHSSS